MAGRGKIEIGWVSAGSGGYEGCHVAGLDVNYQRLGRQLCNIPKGGGSVHVVGEFRASLCGVAQISMGTYRKYMIVLVLAWWGRWAQEMA